MHAWRTALIITRCLPASTWEACNFSESFGGGGTNGTPTPADQHLPLRLDRPGRLRRIIIAQASERIVRGVDLRREAHAFRAELPAVRV